MRMSSPACCFRLVTASMMSSLSSVLFHSSGSCKLVEATNLGRLFIRSVKGVARPQRPGSDELLPGDPAEQKSVAREELVGLPLRGVVVPVRDSPAAVLIPSGVAGVFSDAVE